MTQRHPLWLPLSLAVAGALTLSACDRRPEEPTAGQQLDSTIAKADEATQEMKQDAREGMADAQSSVQDATITAKVNAALAADDRLSALKIDVDTKNGSVTLRGTAPDAVSLSRATELAGAVEGVTKVNNELKVAGASS